jgi:uncharacterized membrane protein YkvA (DUF1232 family)
MPFERATSWENAESGAAAARHAARDEETVRSGFWRKASRVAARLPFAEDLLTAYYCALDRDTPTRVRAALFGALAYFTLPFDLTPDVLPLVGFTDDAAVLAAVIALVVDHIRPAHRDAARRALAGGMAKQ